MKDIKYNLDDPNRPRIAEFAEKLRGSELAWVSLLWDGRSTADLELKRRCIPNETGTGVSEGILGNLISMEARHYGKTTSAALFCYFYTQSAPRFICRRAPVLRYWNLRKFLMPEGFEFYDDGLLAYQSGPVWKIPSNSQDVWIEFIDDAKRGMIPSANTRADFVKTTIDRKRSAEVLARTKYREFAEYLTLMHPLLNSDPEDIFRKEIASEVIHDLIQSGDKKQWLRLIELMLPRNAEYIRRRTRMALRKELAGVACLKTVRHSTAPDLNTAKRWLKAEAGAPYA